VESPTLSQNARDFEEISCSALALWLLEKAAV